jgi:hypothetical protein
MFGTVPNSGFIAGAIQLENDKESSAQRIRSGHETVCHGSNGDGLQISIPTLKGFEEGFGVDSLGGRSSGEIRRRLTLKRAEVRRKHQASAELVTLAPRRYDFSLVRPESHRVFEKKWTFNNQSSEQKVAQRAGRSGRVLGW